jgi:hypothetical protein
MPVFVTGMTKHAAGQSTASLTVAGALKLAVPVGISVQYLNGLMLAAGGRRDPEAAGRAAQVRRWPAMRRSAAGG